MSTHEPGPLASEKSEPNARRPQPAAQETESARLLVNDAKDRLPGVPEEDIIKLADRFIAEDRGETVDEFVDWICAS